MAAGDFRFFLDKPLPEEDAAVFGRIVPGAFVRGTLIAAPENCAFLVERELARRGERFKMRAPEPRPRVRWSEVVAATQGELLPWVPEFLCDYQKLGVTKVVNMPNRSGSLHHPTGSGKTLSAAVWSLFNAPRESTIVVVTKAAARNTIYRDWLRYTTVQPLVLVPKSDLTKKSDVDPRDTLRSLLADNRPPRCIVAGWESLAADVDLLLSCSVGAVVFDEIHKAAQHRRWAVVPGVSDGDTKLEFTRLNNISAVAKRLSSNARHRLGTTATPVPDRTRQLWAQLDLIHPWAFGKAWDFMHRYCDPAQTNWGSLDTRGSSNLDELNQRLDFVRHFVDYSVTHRALPPKRRQVLYLTKSQQDRPDAFAEELRRAQKLGRGAVVEVKIAEAASRKRSAITEQVKDSLGAGGKVVIFTNRHRAAERLGKTMSGLGCPTWMAHGGHTAAERDRIRDEYMSTPGPCVLIGTGEAWGESLNLQDTDLAIFAALPINAKQLQQWEGRFSRHGQQRPVLILYVVAEGTIDEHVNSILLNKLPAVEALTGDSEVTKAYADLAGSNDEGIIDSLFTKIMEEPV